MILVKKLYKKYPGAAETAVDNVSFELEEGKCLALLGPSGSGKTTILKMINALIKADSGEIFINGKSINDFNLIELRQKVAYVFQKGLLFPHLTVEGNIALPLKSYLEAGLKNAFEFSFLISKKQLNKTHARVIELMKLMDLDPHIFLNRFPHELSGGQAQRVSLAQAMALDPEVLLMDEPFNGLDRKTKYSLMEKILQIKDEFKKTIILVTHDVDEAKFFSDQILELN